MWDCSCLFIHLNLLPGVVLRIKNKFWIKIGIAANTSSVGHKNKTRIYFFKSMVYSLPKIASVLVKNVFSFPSCDSCSYRIAFIAVLNSQIAI